MSHHASERLIEQDSVMVTPKTINIPNNVYLNLQLKGGESPNRYTPHIRAGFDQTFTESILQKSEDYYVTLVTASIPTHSIPLAIFNAIKSGPTQNNSNLSSFVLTLGYNNDYYAANVLFIPSSTKLAPSPPSSNAPTYKQYADAYYNIYNYNQLCRMINNTLSSIYSTFFGVHGSINGLLITDAPYIIFDDDTNKFCLIYEKKFVGSGISLYYNDLFDIKFGGFDSYWYGSSGNDRDWSFNFIDSNNNEYDTNHFCNKQQYVSSNTWQTVNQLLFISTSMRTRAEWIGFNDSTQATVGSILFSLNPSFDTLNEQKSKQTYTASGNYRLVDIMGTSHLNTVNISIYYTDNDNNTYPLYLSSLETATIKLLFVKKSLYNSMWG